MEVNLSDLNDDLFLDGETESIEGKGEVQNDPQTNSEIDQEELAEEKSNSELEKDVFPEFIDEAKADEWNQEANEFINRMRADESLEKETRFYTCQVCGDNWLSIKETNGTECEITFIHQMGIQPTLRRVALMTTSIVLNENTVESWEYYFGEDKIDEDDWHGRLKGRRQVLKSICSN